MLEVMTSLIWEKWNLIDFCPRFASRGGFYSLPLCARMGSYFPTMRKWNFLSLSLLIPSRSAPFVLHDVISGKFSFVRCCYRVGWKLNDTHTARFPPPGRLLGRQQQRHTPTKLRPGGWLSTTTLSPLLRSYDVMAENWLKKVLMKFS